jgi:hypothetical protein
MESERLKDMADQKDEWCANAVTGITKTSLDAIKWSIHSNFHNDGIAFILL